MTVRNSLLAALLALLWTAHVAAEDIDLFMINESTGGALPNVLIILDNSANWNAQLGSLGTKRYNELAALKHIFSSDEHLGTIRLGIMLFSPENPRGGYVYSRIRTFDEAYQDELVKPGGLIDSIPQANNAPYALAMHEAYRYFAGETVRVGLPPEHDPLAINGGAYMSPVTANCQKNYILFIGNGAPQPFENDDALAELQALGGNTNVITFTPNNFQSNWMDEHARFMDGVNLSGDPYAPQNIITHTVAVYDPEARDQNTQPLISARLLLKSAAGGEERYHEAHDEEDLVNVFKKFAGSIQAVNSVFASTSLPVSVNVRGTHLNQVYMGVFRPDGEKRPRWYGNLKLYQLGRSDGTGQVFLADANGMAAQSGATGFIVHDATSFWTEGSSYWAFKPRGIPPSASDAPDGPVVEKGGVAQKLRAGTVGNREIFTCTTGCVTGAPLANTPFEVGNTNITAAALGVGSGEARDGLIAWVRGADNKLDENGDEDFEDVRASVHGDVLHSRPAVLNYGGDGDNNIVVFYGSNDGLFRAIRGGTGEHGGTELWSFVPPEFFGRLDILRENETADKDAVGWKPYFVDGSIGVYRTTSGENIQSAHLYLSMRRGGRFLYALDVTDPHDPKLLWRRGSDSGGGWAELGYTWSEPKAVRIAGRDHPVLVFGGGYDPEADDRNEARSMGRGIFVVDSMTGNILWHAGASGTGATVEVADMVYSIPSDVTAIDTSGNRLVDRLYVGDTGGNLWRVDVGSADMDEWAVHKLAALGGEGSDARRFLYPPDVVLGSDGAGSFFGVVIGSGDREKPFDRSIQDRLYMVKDRLDPVDTITHGEELLNVTDVAIVPDDDHTGWYINLHEGEKVVTSALTLANTVTFATNQPAPPDASTCVNLGIARIYAIDFRNGGSRRDDGERFRTPPGGGFPPSPVYFITPVGGDEDGEGAHLEEGLMLGTNVEQSQSEPLNQRRRTYWYKEHE